MIASNSNQLTHYILPLLNRSTFILPHSVDRSDLDSISRLTSLVHIRVVLIG